MRRIIKSFIISSIIGLYCNPIMASALEYFDYDFENGSTFIYKIVDDEITIVQYECSLEGINGDIIPDEIDGYPVTTIAYGSFRMMPFLESITLPETLVTIEYEAFAGDEGLTSIVIPRSVKEIGYCAFGYDYDPFEDRASKKYSDFTIYGYTGTAAETYANENGFTFIALDDDPDTTTTTTDVTTTTTDTTTTTATDVTTTTTDITTTTTNGMETTTETTTTSDKELTTTTTESEITSTATTVGTTSSASDTTTETAPTTTTDDTTLPQTGYSKWYHTAAVLAACMTGIGGAMVISSGVMKQKRR